MVEPHTTVSARVCAPADHAASRATRYAAIEWLRFAACLAIVNAHCHSKANAVDWVGGVGAMQVFVVLTAAFTVLSERRRTAAALMRANAQRLLLPWLFWSAIFAVAKLAESMLTGRTLWSEFEPWMWWTGPSLHLWFLPFAFILNCLLGFAVVCRILPSGPSAWLVWTVLSVPIWALCAHFAGVTAELVAIHQWIFALPGLPIGLALAALGVGARGGIPRVAATAAVACAAGLLLVRQMQLGPATLLPAAVGATIAVAAAWCVRWRAGVISVFVGGLSYGVYLIHPLVGRVLKRLGEVPDAHLRAVVIAVLSIAIVALMKRTRLERFV